MFRLTQINASPLRGASFRRLWLGLLISRLGDQFTIIALLWFVLELTGSGLALGLVLLCFSLPAIVTSPLLGGLLDRYQPRIVMGLDNTARALIIGAIPVLYWLHALQMWMVYMLALAAGTLAPATAVGVRVLLPHLVEDEELERANALAAATQQFPYLIGPAVAGVLVTALGGPPVILLDAASFLVIAVLLFLLPNVARQPVAPDAHVRVSWIGFRVVVGRTDVRLITALSAVFFLAYWPLEPALPVYSRNVLAAGAAGYGLLWSGFGVGALLGLLAIPWIGRQARPGVALAAIAVLWGLLLLPLAFLHTIIPAMLFLGLAGCAWAPYTAVETTLMQRLVPAHQHGHVFGAHTTLTTAASPLGLFLGGALLTYVSASAVIGISAAACIAAGGAGLLSPTLRAIRRTGSEDNAPVGLTKSV